MLFSWLHCHCVQQCTEGKNGVILTQKVESLAELEFDPKYRVIREYLSQCRVNIIQIILLTLNIESIWLKYYPITRNPGSNSSSASDSTFWVKMTPFFLSVGLLWQWRLRAFPTVLTEQRRIKYSNDMPG